MSNMTVSSSSSLLILDKEMDHLMTLCSYISQISSRIRLMHLSNISFSPDYIQLYHQQLLSMAENIEGSAVLLESLLAIEQRKSISIQPKKSRYHYTRDELLKLRHRVTPSLSIQMKKSLNLVVECEENYTTKFGKKSSRNIRTILT